MAWTTPTTVNPGDAILSSLWNEQVRDNSAYLKAEADAVGLVHIATASNSGTNTLSVNNCFTSDYQNYRLVWLETSPASANLSLLIRLRASGTDAVGTDYYARVLRFTSTTTIITLTGTTYMTIGLISSTGAQNGFGSIEISRPAQATRTAIYSQSWYAANTEAVFSAGQHDLSTAYDGFSLVGDSSSTFTATVRVYGYNNG